MIAADPDRGSWTPTSACSATRACSCATARRARQCWRQPIADDHRALAEHAMSHVPALNAGTSAARAEPVESTIAAS